MKSMVNSPKFGEMIYSKKINLWDEKTGKIRVWKKLHAVKIREDIDYYSIFDGNVNDIGRLFLLIHNINYDNYVCSWDKHLRCQIPITSNAELMKILNISNRNTLKKFIDKLVKNDIIAIKDITSIATGRKLRRYIINPIYGIKSPGISPSLYMLFHKSIDPKIGNFTRTCLAALAAEQEGLNDDLNRYNTFFNDTYSSMNLIDIFHEYVLRGESPMIYEKINNGFFSSEINMDNDIYFLVNGTKEYLHKKPSNNDITEFRNWFVDIDAGKDENGKYFSDEEVLIRKQYMCETVLQSLPTPTLVVETRNGYHIYWSCIKGISAEDWNRIEQKIHDIVSVADHAVKDASRILRMPNTMWVKPDKGYNPVEVKPVFGTPIQYGVEDFEAILCSHAEKITASCRTYTNKYPIFDKQNSSKNVSAHDNKITPIRIISNTPGIKESIYDNNRAREIARSIDIAEWLGIDKPTSFCCILPDHEDRHPSASIYRNSDHDRYYCHCCNDRRGLDSIALAERLHGFSYQEAVEYLCSLQGFEYKAKHQKIA